MSELGFPTCVGSIGDRAVADNNGQWFRDLAVSGKFKSDGGEEVVRCALPPDRCRQAKSLDVPNKIKIRFEPITDAYKVVPDYLAKPVVLGRFTVIREETATASEEKYFEIKAGTEQIDRWHLLVLEPSESATEAKWSVVRVEENKSASPSRFSARRVQTSSFYNRCPKVGHVAESGAFARFLTCEEGFTALSEAKGLHSAISEDSVVAIRNRSDSPFFSPIWLTCGLGCCEVRF